MPEARPQSSCASRRLRLDRRNIERAEAFLVRLIHRQHDRRRLRTRRLILGNVRHREHDAAMNWVNLEDTHIEIHRLVYDVGWIVDRLAGWAELRDRNKPFDVIADVDDHALVHQADDLARQIRPDGIRLTDTEPWIFLGLLETERDALVLRVDVQNHDVDRVALLHDFRRMLYALGPAHIGDMDQTIYPWLNLNKCSEARQVAHFAIDARTDRIFERQDHPGILLGLFHTERDFLLVRIDLEDDRFDRLAD